MNKVECFKIQLLMCDDIFDIEKSTVIKTILNDKQSLIREPRTILADPFLFVKGDRLYLFYEDKKLFHDGVISMISTCDLKTWTDPVTVLKESCHLSYPWVFVYNEEIYMIPETSGLESIRLYKGNEDLTNFTYIKTLLSDESSTTCGFSYSDSSVVFKEGACYLMTSINDGKNNVLKLFVANDLFDEFVEHQSSPISVSNKYGRNAGSVFEYNGILYRVSQDCVCNYGDNVHLMRITKMNVREYQEVNVMENIFPNKGFYKMGGHQLNFVMFKGKKIVATDAKEYRWFLFNRIINKIKRNNYLHFAD